MYLFHRRNYNFYMLTFTPDSYLAHPTGWLTFRLNVVRSSVCRFSRPLIKQYSTDRRPVSSPCWQSPVSHGTRVLAHTAAHSITSRRPSRHAVRHVTLPRRPVTTRYSRNKYVTRRELSPAGRPRSGGGPPAGQVLGGLR